MKEEKNLIEFRLEQNEQELFGLQKKVDDILSTTSQLLVLSTESKKLQETTMQKIILEEDRVRKLEVAVEGLKTDREWLKKLNLLLVSSVFSGVVAVILSLLSLFIKK